MCAKHAAAARLADRISTRVPFIIAAFVIAIVAAPVVAEFSGIPEKQALAREARQAEANRWDEAFCEKYGMPRGSERHRACLNDLLDLRRQEGKRLAEQVEDVL